jgi:TRAP-type C4-dicarboxylate transport system permease small subunit
MKLPLKGKKLSCVLTHFISMALFAVMIVYGCKFAYFVRLQVSPALQMPKWIIMGIIPISGTILMVHGLCFLLDSLLRGHHDH